MRDRCAHRQRRRDALQRRLRPSGLADRPAGNTAEYRAQHRGRNGPAAAPRTRRIEQAHRDRLLEHGLKRGAQCLAVRAVGLEPCRELRIGRQLGFDFGAPRLGQPAVDKGLQIGFGNTRFVHLTTCKRSADGVPSIAVRNLSRARDRRDITVPIGTPSVVATSW